MNTIPEPGGKGFRQSIGAAANSERLLPRSAMRGLTKEIQCGNTVRPIAKPRRESNREDRDRSR